MTCWNLLRWSFRMLCGKVRIWARGCGDARWQLMPYYTGTARPPTTTSSTPNGKTVETTDILTVIQHVIEKGILRGLVPHTDPHFPQNTPRGRVLDSSLEDIVTTKSAHLITNVASASVKRMGGIRVRTNNIICASNDNYYLVSRRFAPWVITITTDLSLPKTIKDQRDIFRKLTSAD